MGHPTYQHMDEIPCGMAGDTVTDGCLVLEGGAFRGLYTQGVIDTLLLAGINLSCTIGVSAGAIAGLGYVAGQIGHSARVNLTYRHDSRYVGLRALARSGSILDVGFLTEDRGILEPLDQKRFDDPRRRFVAVATNCETGEPTFFEKGVCDDIALAVRASATMPVIAPMVWIDGTPYLDGACSNKIPYQWALDEGYERILVIRTRDVSFRKELKPNAAAHLVYRAWPSLLASLDEVNALYNRQCQEIEQLHANGRLMRIAPSEPITIAKLEGDLDRLGDLYWLGCYDATEQLDQIRTYLGI